jgi:nitrite reductase/ring-hydroxylating ferredoxin subunit
MADAGWVRVAAAAAVAEGEMVGVRAGDLDIAVYNLSGGEFRATSNVCTHEYAQLSDGFLEGGVVECPLHGGKFDVRTGQAVAAPCQTAIQVFDVRVEGEDVLLKLPAFT